MSEHFDFSRINLRALKGAPISVLVCLALARRPIGAEQIERDTGYSDKPVTNALEMFLEWGLVARLDRNHWTLTAGAQQLPLMAVLLPPPEDDPEPPASRRNSDSEKFRLGEIPTPAPEVIDVTPTEPPASRRNSDSSPKTTAGVGEIPTPADPSSSSSLTNKLEIEPLTTRVVAELTRWGICDPARSEIAAIPGITPEFIRGHVCTAKNTGMAIHRIRKGWKVPAGYQDPDSVSVETVEQPELTETPPPEPEPLPPPDPRLMHIWQPILGQLRAQMRQVDFTTWMAPAVPLALEGEIFTVGVPNAYARDWLESRLTKTINGLLSPFIGCPVTVRFVICTTYLTG